MNLFSTGLERWASRCVLAAACAWLAVAGVAAPARGQCNPQELAKLIASDATAGDNLGWSVAVSDDTVLLGAHRDAAAGPLSGSAYVFVRTGGVWTEQAKLTASDAAASDQFGISVAVSGDTAVIGAYSADHAGGSNAGAAYVFVRTGGAWAQQAKLIALDGAENDFFGISVAVSSDTVVVGANGDDDAGASSGSVYVFVRSGVVWTQQAKLIASDAASDSFGLAVAVTGDTAVVGAPYRDFSVAVTDVGAAYVFVRTGSVWSQQARLYFTDPSGVGDLFGISVAVSGETALVGAIGKNAGATDSGAAYVFTRSGSAWTQQAKLSAFDAAQNDQFGISVAVSGDLALVGAHYDDHAGGNGAGSAYTFVRNGGVWTQQAKLIATDTAAGDFFGNSVAASSDAVVLGAHADDHAGGTDAGAAYIFGPSDQCADDDGDGVLNYLDACPNNAPGLTVDATGRPQLDRNSDCLVDGADIQLIVEEMLNQW